MGREQRDAERRDLFLYFDVLDREQGQRLGQMADVSEHGLMFVSEGRIESGERLAVSIWVPAEYPDLTSVDADLEVLWVRPNINPEQTCYGCRFLEVDRARLARLLEITEQVSFGTEFDVTRVSRTP